MESSKSLADRQQSLAWPVTQISKNFSVYLTKWTKQYLCIPKQKLLLLPTWSQSGFSPCKSSTACAWYGCSKLTCKSSSPSCKSQAACAGLGPQGYSWPAPNMMPPNMQSDAGFRPSVAMDPSMMPPYQFSSGIPQWQPQSMSASQGLPQTQAQSDQGQSQQLSSNQ